MSVTEVTAAQVKNLRDLTGAAMMACKKALIEAEGNVEKAVELLRARGEAQAAKRAGNEATEGTVQTYIHSNGKVGVLVEVDCETDFVARNDNFVQFAKDLAMHIAAAAPLGVSDADIPADLIESERRIAAEQAMDRPENVRERIVEGKINKFLDETVLLRQAHVNPKYEEKTIEDLRAKLASDTGENVIIRRFTRFQVGS
ncbi:translation elongation factor Ts [Conexibacter sp. DBS9H8]|uniref:translation elongation factor Ts n=1 Tax=Conexibacter sp. DBS9H8 TaxID=2937801 RepID=UPI00201082BF|nr:translation elongation factor Ts [Conexibacter sp. DBS9H8]